MGQNGRGEAKNSEGVWKHEEKETEQKKMVQEKQPNEELLKKQNDKEK